MAGIGNFQVRFGINDTALTRALDSGDFERAFTIIEENATDPEFFNDGPYERIPLYIVLCGKGLTSSNGARNLHVAKVLIDHGADPNLHVPVFNPRWMTIARQFSQSPMELLLDFYIHSLHLYVKDRWNPETSPVIGLNDSLITTFPELREQLLELVDCFIAHRAEVNVYLGDTPALIRLLFTYPDLELTEKLIQAGADITSTDSHGNTPLMALCRPNWKIQNKLHRDENLRDVLKYLLQFTSLDLNYVNCMNQSALWYLFCTNSLNLAQILLEANADPSIAGVGYTPCGPCQSCPDVLIGGRIPAVLMSLTRTLKSSFVYLDDWKAGELPFTVSEELSALVDSGLLNRYFDKLERSLFELLQWNQYISMHFTMLEKLLNKNFIIPSLLGKTSLTLRQRCARTIFSCCLGHLTAKYGVYKEESDEKEITKMDQSCHINSDSQIENDAQLESVPEDVLISIPYQSRENNILHIKSLFMQKLFQIKCEDLIDLIEKLCLPLPFSTFLNFELYRWKLLLLLANSHYDRLSCYCEIISTLDSVSDSDISANTSSIEVPEELLFEQVDSDEDDDDTDGYDGNDSDDNMMISRRNRTRIQILSEENEIGRAHV